LNFQFWIVDSRAHSHPCPSVFVIILDTGSHQGWYLSFGLGGNIYFFLLSPISTPLTVACSQCSSAHFMSWKNEPRESANFGSFWRIYYRKMSLKVGYLWEQMNVWIIWNKFRLCLQITSKAHFKTYLCFSVFLILPIHICFCLYSGGQKNVKRLC